MARRPLNKFQYIPVIALALSFVLGGYVYSRTLDEWLTDIVSSYMLDLLKDVNHEIKRGKLHLYDFTPHEIDQFLDNLSQSSSQRRFTIIHESGKVLGDSILTKKETYHLGSFSQRPEVVSALATGHGIAKRHSETNHQEVLYVAARLEIDDHEHDHLMANKSVIEPKEHEHDDHEKPNVAEQNEHEMHSSVYILRLAMPMTSLRSMSEDLRFILFLLMGCSMGVLIASSWFSQRKITQVINEERQQQQTRIDKSTREIELLRQLANMLAACKDIHEAQLVVKDIVPRLLGNVNGCISIMRESRNLLEVEIDWGEKWPAATAFSPQDCWAMRKGKAHLSHDKHQSLNCNHMSRKNTKDTTLCIPLTAHGNTVGIIHLNFPNSGSLVPDDIQQLAFTLAEHLGLALANLRLQDKLRSQALRDSLTGLYNRRYFEDKLEKEWSLVYQSDAPQPLSIIMLDLDHFKRFNDNFGHDAGDYVLKELASLLMHSIDDRSVVCRLGGEEFSVICPNTSEPEAIAVAETIIKKVRELHLSIKGLSLGQLGISAGISTYLDICVPEEELVKLADTALYKAKERGRAQAVHANQLPDNQLQNSHQ